MADQRKIKPHKPFTEALYDFLCMARDRPQSDVIRYFLEQVIEHSDLCEQGSVLLYVAPAKAGAPGKLALWGAATNVNSLAALLEKGVAFNADEGLAALAFRKRAPEFAAVATKHPQFVRIEGQDIGAIYCVPIVLADRVEPFGVAAFHNPVGGRSIGADQQRQMDVAVKVLESMLNLSPRKLVRSDRVFIVHGRDERFRKELEMILLSENVEPVVIQSLARTGQDLLEFLEDQIRDCVAGFVLLTPDDEGRLYRFGEPLRQRARQNVIFEGGYLTALFRGTQRICFLQLGDLEIPSDLNGLLMERFIGRVDPERIRLTLREWGIRPEGKPAQRGRHESSRPAMDGSTP
jgi:predicted nucleotide-binding protein